MVALCLRHRFSQLPHGLGLSPMEVANSIIHDVAACCRILESRGQQSHEILPRIRGGEFDEQIPGSILVHNGSATPGMCFTVSSNRKRGNQPDSRSLDSPAAGAQARQQIQGMLLVNRCPPAQSPYRPAAGRVSSMPR